MKKIPYCYRYTISDPVTGGDVVAHYGRREEPLAALVANLNRAIGYDRFVGRTYRDDDGHLHCVDMVPCSGVTPV